MKSLCTFVIVLSVVGAVVQSRSQSSIYSNGGVVVVEIGSPPLVAIPVGPAVPIDTHIVAWGAGQKIANPPDFNNYGQSVPPGINHVFAIAGGWRHSLALTTERKIVGWGSDTFGQSDFPEETNYIAIACGSLHSLALRSDGTVIAAGDDGFGQIEVPEGLSNVVAIACGFHHSLALQSNGTVVAWGANADFVGIGTDPNYGQTHVPSTLSNVVAIAGGGWHSLALRADATVAAWGRADSGQADVPIGLTNIVAISAGAAHNLVLRSDGTVFAWGNSSYGQTNIPAGLSNVIAIAAGGWHNVALKDDGTVIAWGAGGPSTNALVVCGQNIVPATATNVIRIAAGFVHSLAIALGPPSYAPTAGSYSGVFFESNNVDLATSGAINIASTIRGSYSGSLQMGTKRYSFSGKFDQTGAATNQISRRSVSALTLNLQMDITDNGRITGTIGDGAWVAKFHANRAAAKLGTNSTAGKYTFDLPGVAEANSTFPHGDGYAILTLSAAGNVQYAVTLADGTRIRQTTTVSKSGEWPIYIALYGGKGHLVGWMNFTNSASRNLYGDLNWTKSASPGSRLYPLGFDLTVTPTGSSYNPAARPATVFTNAWMEFDGGSLASGLTNHIVVQTNNNVLNLSSNKLVLKLDAASGAFSGTGVDPATKKTISFSGAVLQKQRYGAGYFLNANLSGRVLVAP